MKPIRREISAIVGVQIPPEGWDATFRELEAQGKIGPKQTTEMLLVVLKKLEALEAK